MSQNAPNQKIYKGIDIYDNCKEYSPKEGERNNFIQNKMMKFFKKISDSIFFTSDSKGTVYCLEFNKDTKTFKLTNLNYICDDSKYILIDIIKSSKFDFYFSLNLNPCLNIFKIKDNINKKEVEIIQHINLRKNQNRMKYNKIFELNLIHNDCLILFGENLIEIWSNIAKNKNINYGCSQILKIDNINNINNDINDSCVISNIYKLNNENILLLNLSKFEIINIKISEIKSQNDGNKISPLIDIKNKINIKGVEGQIEKISSLFMDKNYIFLGLTDSLVLISISYAEIIQLYKIGKVVEMKITNDKKHIFAFIDKGENKYFFIKFKYVDYEGLIEDKRIEYPNWIHKFDIIEEQNLIIIYNIKGLITLLSFD